MYKFKFKFKDILNLVFTVLIFIIALMFINYFITTEFPKLKELSTIPTNVIMTLFSAALAGAFTLLGVEKTFEKQNKTEFVKEFPMKIYYLDELIKELQTLKKVVTISHSPFLIVDKNKIASFFTTVTEIDGYLYFKVREAHMKFSGTIDLMFNDPEKRIFFQNDFGEHHLINGKETENESRVLDLQIIVNQLIEECDTYRNSFIEYYNKNVDQDIYNSINL